MTYKRVTLVERRLIRMWRQAGYGQREIARRLGRSPSSICREIERNSWGNGYQPHQAHAMAQERAKRPGPRRFTEEVKDAAETRLKSGWTPDMISGRARLERRPWVCKETIYKHIYADAKEGGDLWQSLPRAYGKRRRRCPRTDGRKQGQIANRRMIDTPPSCIRHDNCLVEIFFAANFAASSALRSEKQDHYLILRGLKGQAF
ncbi:MAG: IS30 family transposase [Candidatus Promineifilaceae bacterium]